MVKKDKTKPFRVIGSGGTTDPESPTNPTGPTAEEMVMNCAISKLKADRTPIPDNRFTLPPEYGVDGSGSSDAFNGHEYVDLGLPSGTLWAKMNVGANSETDYGLYFAWGETEGYTDASTKAFSWVDYKYGDGSTFTKYNSTDGKTALDLEDDAASVNMGGDWHMPTNEQFQELLNTTYVTNTWVTNYNGSGVNGCLFTSVSNGNTMFVPAAAICQDGRVGNVGNYGDIWASTRDFRGVKIACYFDFTSSKTRVLDDGYRYSGQSVRGVIGQMDEITPGGGGTPK